MSEIEFNKLKLGVESPKFVKEVLGEDAKILCISVYHQTKDGTTMKVDMKHKDFYDEEEHSQNCSNTNNNPLTNPVPCKSDAVSRIDEDAPRGCGKKYYHSSIHEDDFHGYVVCGKEGLCPECSKTTEDQDGN